MAITRIIADGVANTAITSLGTLSTLTVDNLNINGNTISSTSGALNITPAGGSAIVLDGTVNVDAGVITGATSITSTAFVGTLSTAAQPNITSLGTIAAFRSTGIDDNSNALAMTIDSSENIGIGTTAPANKLDVVGNGARSVARGSSTAGQSWLEAQASNYWSGPTYTGTSISQYGSTASGTTAGLSNANLGSLLFQNVSASLIYNNSSAPIVFATASTEGMRILAGGNVGIGTATPTALLNVKKGATADSTGQPSGNFAAIVYHGTNSSTSHGLLVKNNWAAAASTILEVGLDISGGAYRQYYKIDGSGQAIWSTGTTEKMRLTTAGNVGIGTAAPSNSLDVRGSGVYAHSLHVGDRSLTNGFLKASCGWDGVIRLNSGSASTIYVNREVGATRDFHIWNGTNVSIMTVQGSTARVGIGTTAPSGAFHVKGGRSFHAAANEPFALAAAYGATGGSVYFGAKSISGTPDAQISAATGAALMTLQNNGYIGIGTGTPAYKLDVWGSVRTGGIIGGFGNTAGNFHIDSANVNLPATNILTGSFYINYSYGTGGVRCMNGATGYGTAYAAAFSVVSDRRLKENISYFDSGLAKILQLKPATFDFINGENNQKGFIAQDVETVIPEVVRSVDTLININTGETKEYLSVDKAAMVPYLVAAIKEQQAMILALTDRIATLEA